MCCREMEVTDCYIQSQPQLAGLCYGPEFSNLGSLLEHSNFRPATVQFIFRSIVALHNFRLKPCSGKYIVPCSVHLTNSQSHSAELFYRPHFPYLWSLLELGLVTQKLLAPSSLSRSNVHLTPLQPIGNNNPISIILPIQLLTQQQRLGECSSHHGVNGCSCFTAQADPCIHEYITTLPRAAGRAVCNASRELT